MDSVRPIALGITITLALSACATDSRPPAYFSTGISAELAAQILSDYLAFLPDEWERGTITVKSCSDANIEVDCDYFVEHETRSCDFGAYLILFPAGTGLTIPFFKAFPDERALECIT